MNIRNLVAKLHYSIICILVATLFSCENENKNLGENIYPESKKNQIANDSSINLMAYSFEEEDYISTTRSIGKLNLGYQNDLLFGTLQCDLITHIGLSSKIEEPLIKEGLEIEIDSCILYLDFKNTEGDISKEQKFNVFELNKDVTVSELDKKEYYNHTLNGFFDITKPLATFKYMPQKEWKTTSKFKLPKSFADKLINKQVSYEGKTVSAYSKLSLFNKHILNGLYLQAIPSENSNAIVTLSKVGKSDSTRLVLYYKVKENEDYNKYSYEYNIVLQTKANIFQTNLKKELVYNKMYTSLGMAKTDTSVYIKNNNGLYTKIIIENIGNWQDSGVVAINKAMLVLPSKARTFPNYTLEPISLIYAYRQKNSLNIPLEKYKEEKGKILPIAYNKNKKQYEIVVTNEVQQLYSQKKWTESIDIIVKSATNNQTARSSVINSPINTTKPMKLVLIYTKY